MLGSRFQCREGYGARGRPVKREMDTMWTPDLQCRAVRERNSRDSSRLASLAQRQSSAFVMHRSRVRIPELAPAENSPG